MASKGPRSKLDNDTRARRLKILEPPKEPHRPKTHWDHVLEEMVWLSKDFESERKWKISHAKKIALRASKGKLDQATRGEKRMKEEEQRMRKIASNISKDVKKFWTKIEKLVLYKYQLELDDKKKKALDKQLEYLLGQTERYSNMLAENLLGTTKSSSAQPIDMLEDRNKRQEESSEHYTDASHELFVDDESVKDEVDNDFAIDSEDDTGDDEQTIEEDEALITEDERMEELEALQDEMDLPIEQLLQQYTCEANRGRSPEVDTIAKQSLKEADQNGRIELSATDKIESVCSPHLTDTCVRSNGFLHSPEDHLSDRFICQTKNIRKAESCSDYEPMDNDFNRDQDDVSTIREELAQAGPNGTTDEMALLQKDSEIPIEELLARYKDSCNDGSERDSKEEGSEYSESEGSQSDSQYNFSDSQEDGDFDMLTDEEKDDETTLEVEEMSLPESSSPLDEIALLQKESEIPMEVLLARYDEDPTCHGSERELKHEHTDYDFDDDQEDGEFFIDVGEDKDDETTLVEEEELAEAEPGSPVDEVDLLQKDSEISMDYLLARYKDSSNNGCLNHDNASSNSSAYSEPPGPVIEFEPMTKANSSVENNVSGDLLLDSPSCREAALAAPVISSEGESEKENIIVDAAAAARSAQPTGNTLSTTSVRTKLPFLLKYSLREYQHIGLDWLVTMYEKKLNGILADEMGLGKTIMTIALLAHLACDKGIWGPHLIVVPTSVMLNWETEFLKWCPALKILTYFGSAKERKHKRQGWMKPNSFHVCITTYRLVIQDSKIFKRKKWKYLILDEAHLIKNWKSQRWQTLLNFNSKRRILLTGTPLQNDLMELWSLMHFLMPHVFQSHQEFKDWFCNPISGMVEGQEKVNKEVVDRLHNVLRPFILRRLKRDVETQLPKKQEHVICCRLSKRQRNLYEDFIASSETQATLASTNFFGMLSVIMQLRKVCNHPDLFEGRPIVSSFDMDGINMRLSSDICSVLQNPVSCVDLSGLGFLFTHLDFTMASWEADEIQSIATPSNLIKDRTNLDCEDPSLGLQKRIEARGTNLFVDIRRALWEERVKEAKDRATALAWWNTLRCQKRPVYGTALRHLVTIEQPVDSIHYHKSNCITYEYSSKLGNIVLSPVERFMTMIEEVESFMFTIPPARAPPPVCWCSKPNQPVIVSPSYEEECSRTLLPLLTPFRPAIVRRQLYFPDRRLIQFDCGKLQQLAVLLRRLKSEGHRALIFTQMTKMLDILEAFINLYGYTYMRLDGSTQPEERQTLMQRFNTNPKIFLFILSTRSGGVGINLVGADTVIFYDSDWNPAMDQQAQDRCHRIGQTRAVHIYRLVSESTIEENILKKANQKRALDDLVIQSGGYNTEFFKKLDPMELFSGHKVGVNNNIHHLKGPDNENEDPMSNVDLEAALKLAEDEADYMALKRVEQEEAVENQEFTEETIGRPDDDDLVNEDDARVDAPAGQEALDTPTSKECEPVANGNDLDGEKALAYTCDDDDVDMLADVKQMAAAAAAAGHASSSFENQLRPIDRYAIRFLEMWDPIIDKNAVDYQVKFEEAEWELERLEKLKEDMEAEIDEDEEPLVYESWDADSATVVYRRQVEMLAHHQLMEELEQEAKEKEMKEKESRLRKKDTAGGSKSKSKKKSKKVKFKSLKNASMLVADKSMTGDGAVDSLLLGDDYTCIEMVSSPDTPSTDMILLKKRKNLDTDLESGEETNPKLKSKKMKRIDLVQCLPSSSSSLLNSNDGTKNLKSNEVVGIDQKIRPAMKGKTGGKISISAMPIKRYFMIKPEKLKKKGNIWSIDFLPPPDTWWAQEDAILCALVHEYGPNWCMVSDTLFGMTASGLYRGRFRHHVHCCERFRELIQKYVVNAADSLSNDKACNTGSSKSLLKVSEENVQALLDAAMKFQDRELLIQRHFTSLLSTVWKMKLCHDQQKTVPHTGLTGIRLFNSSANFLPEITFQRPLDKMKLTNLPQGHKLVSAALLSVDNKQQEGTTSAFNQVEDSSRVEEVMEVTLEFPQTGDPNDVFPSTVMLTICGRDPPCPAVTPCVQEDQFSCSHELTEMRIRSAASGACLANHVNWASSAFSCDSKSHSQGSKSHSLGKHKISSPASETSKASKSKMRKITNSSDENHQRSPEPGHPFLPSALTIISSQNRDKISSLVVEDPAMELISDTLCNLNDEFQLETIGSELIPHCYTPGFISDLEDCHLLPEFSDVG